MPLLLRFWFGAKLLPIPLLKQCRLLLFCLFLSPAMLLAQKSITGQVKDAAGKKLPDISVMIKGKTVTTVTDSAGRFKITAHPGDQLVFSSVNYEDLQLPVDTKNDYLVTLKPKIKDLDDVIVIGYGTTTTRDVTGSVSKAPTETMQKAPVRSFDEALAGRVAGVVVSSVDGQPGSAINIVIRGNNSVTQDNSPLYVIDGFPIENPNNNLVNPQDIESMEVLKDASATAIYGARGANGVIIITTKRGKTGPPTVTFSTSYGIQETPKTMKLMDPYEFVKYQLEQNYQDNSKIYLANGNTVDTYKNIPSIDWQKLMFRTAPMQNHSLSVSGGNAYTKYYISGNYTDQQGIIINSGYKRYQGTISLDQTFSTKARGGIYLNLASNQQYGQPPSTTSNGSGTTAALYSVWGYRNFSIAGVPNLEDVLFDPGIDPTVDFRINPVINQQHLVRQNNTNNTRINAYLEYNILRSLKLRITGGIDNNITQVNQFNDTSTLYGNAHSMIGATNGVNGSVVFYKNMTWINENTLTWSKSFKGGHGLTAVAGFTQTGNKTSSYGLSATNLPNASLGINGLDQGTPQFLTATSSLWGLASFLGRIDYKYKSKYLLTISMRADGSSKFAPGNRWGYFPSGAFAWRFKDEKFLKRLRFLSDGKLRVSYGVTGNNRVNDFAYLSTLTTTTYVYGYTFGNVTSSGTYPSSLGNAGLKWETTSQSDIGVDLGFLNNRINLTADIYRKTTKDLLLYANLPLSLGYSNALRNIGSIQNQGIELTLNTINIRNKRFTWKSSFNISFNSSKVLALTENQAAITSYTAFDAYFKTIPTYISKVGNQLGTMYGYIWQGVYQYKDFDRTTNGGYVLKDNQPTNGNIRSVIQPGDIRFKDINGDGVVDANDYAIIGRGLPIHTGGFNNDFTYKNFDLNIFFQWSYGNNIINANRYLFEGNLFGRANLNQFASYENRWSPTNTSSNMYRAQPGGQGPSTPTGANSRVIEDGSYLRLKTVSLGYNLSPAMLKKLTIKAFRIYVAAQNLYTWTKYTGMDPEVSTFNSVLTPGLDFSAYPRARTLTVGANISF